jgi:hypothetical protein
VNQPLAAGTAIVDGPCHRRDRMFGQHYTGESLDGGFWPFGPISHGHGSYGRAGTTTDTSATPRAPP